MLTSLRIFSFVVFMLSFRMIGFSFVVFMISFRMIGFFPFLVVTFRLFGILLALASLIVTGTK